MAEDAVLNAEALDDGEKDERDERDLTSSDKCFVGPPLPMPQLPLPPIESANRDLV